MKPGIFQSLLLFKFKCLVFGRWTYNPRKFSGNRAATSSSFLCAMDKLCSNWMRERCFRTRKTNCHANRSEMGTKKEHRNGLRMPRFQMAKNDNDISTDRIRWGQIVNLLVWHRNAMHTIDCNKIIEPTRTGHFCDCYYYWPHFCFDWHQGNIWSAELMPRTHIWARACPVVKVIMIMKNDKALMGHVFWGWQAERRAIEEQRR